MKRNLRRGLLLLTLLALLLSISPIAWADGPGDDYTHEFKGLVAEDTVSAQLPGLVYEAIGSALPEVNLSAYKITATTSILDQDGGYSAETVAVLSSKTSYQTEVIRILATYDLAAGTWQVLETDRNYADPAEAADFGGVADEESYAVNNARCVQWAPEPRDPTSQRAAMAIKGYCKRRNLVSDMYRVGRATEARAWRYIKNARKLCFWWHLAHGITSNRNGAPCYGYAFYNAATDQLRHTEFSALTKWAGLKNTVAYMNGCNTWFNPIRSAVITGHQVKTYVGGKILMPFKGTGDCDKKFAWYALIKQRSIRESLRRAERDLNQVGYRGLWGYTGSLVRACRAGPAPTGYGTVKGYVKNAATGRPIRGAKVQVLNAGYAISTTTSATGFYKLTRVPAGFQELRASKTGFRSQKKSVTVNKGKTHRLDFRLRKGGGGTARLTVSPTSQCIKPSGFVYNFSGSGYKGGERVKIWRYCPKASTTTRVLGYLTATSTGRFSFRTTYTGSWQPQTCTMHADGQTSNRKAQVNYRMTSCSGVLYDSESPAEETLE